MYYDDYDYRFSEEDLKTDFHIALDKIIDAEVEKRLEERIEDIAYLREKQKQYDEKIAEANKKVKEADDKRREADRLRGNAERELDNTKKQCKQLISDATQAKLDELFGDWLKEGYAYYVERVERCWAYCPYCSSGKVNITLPNGDKAITTCKVCNGEGYREYDGYEYKSIETTYPTFVKENQGKSIAPYFLRNHWRSGTTRVALRDVMTMREAMDKATKLTEENKQKALQHLKERKEKLDKGELI